MRQFIMFRVTQNFAKWLSVEMERRSWSVSELARRADTYPATISNLINENRKPGRDICKKVAKALNVKESVVLYHAGFLSSDPNDPTQALDPITLDIVSMLENRTEATRRAVRAAIEALLESFGDGKRTDEDSKTTTKPKR